MVADVSGFYSALGLNPGAPIDAVRAAYRRLAKECHPDRPACVDGGQRFRRIAEAYDALSDPTFKSAYDRGSTCQSRTTSSSPPPKVEPIKCEACGSVAAQPRRLAFWRVTSLILASQKTPVQKIFCHKCAAKEQWVSTIWTGLLGWWGVPWGPVWSIGHGLANATGGTRQRRVDDALLWQNAVAFAARGEGALAIGLSNILRKSDNAEIAQRAADIIRLFGGQGFDAATTLKDVWKHSKWRTALLLIVAYAAPIILLAVIFHLSFGSQPFIPSPAWTLDPGTSAVASSTLGADRGPAAVPAVAATSPSTPPPMPTCASPPSNGKIWVDHRESAAGGHHLKIENGTTGDAIIKVRDEGGETLASFFVERNATATLTGIPDGSYRVQFATGDKLAADCNSFVPDGSVAANEFPGPETLETRYEQDFDGTSVIHSELTYTLYPVPGGTVRPNSINMDEFNKP